MDCGNNSAKSPPMKLNAHCYVVCCWLLYLFGLFHISFSLSFEWILVLFAGIVFLNNVNISAMASGDAGACHFPKICTHPCFYILDWCIPLSHLVLVEYWSSVPDIVIFDLTNVSALAFGCVGVFPLPKKLYTAHLRVFLIVLLLWLSSGWVLVQYAALWFFMPLSSPPWNDQS